MDDIASQDAELLIRNNEKNRWGREYFDVSDQGGSTTTGKEKQELEIFWKTERSNLVRLLAKINLVDHKDYDFAEKTLRHIQINH